MIDRCLRANISVRIPMKEPAAQCVVPKKEKDCWGPEVSIESSISLASGKRYKLV